MNQTNYHYLYCHQEQNNFRYIEKNTLEKKQNNEYLPIIDNYHESKLSKKKLINLTSINQNYQNHQDKIINSNCSPSNNPNETHINPNENLNISTNSKIKMNEINSSLNAQTFSQNQQKVFFNNDKRRNTRNRWTQDEENRLINLVSIIGAREWNKISAILKTKTAKQCRDHYANCLNPEIKNSFWTIEEERVLLEKYQEYGSHWSKIKPFLPGRTSSMIKNYISMLLKKNEIKEFQEMDESQNEEYDETASSGTNLESDVEDKNFFLNTNDTHKKSGKFNYFDINSLLV